MDALDFISRSAADAVKRGLAAVTDFALPPQCPVTGELLATPGAVSAGGWRSLTFIEPPYCSCCGLPFAHDPGPDAVCGDCAKGDRDFDHLRAALVYDDASKRLVLGLKHGDRHDGVPLYARWLARCGGDLLARADVIAPVPLHWTRLVSRRFNQSALLAAELGRLVETPVQLGLVVRKRRTAVQGGLNARQRQKNVSGAFAVRTGAADSLSGANVVLVDDVFTTGATAGACARVLRRAGAAEVSVLALARVVRDGQGAI